MTDTEQHSGHGALGLVFGLISLGFHAGAFLYNRGDVDPPSPARPLQGFEKFTSEIVEGLSGLQDIPDRVRTLQALDLGATAFGILGVAFAAIACHRGQRGAVVWFAWIASVVGLFLWAGQIPPGWRI